MVIYSNDHSLQYSCLGNPMDRGAWQATVHGVAKESDMSYWLNNNKYENYITLGLVSFILDHYRVKVDFFPNIIQKYIWSLKTSIYKDKGSYCSPHRRTIRTKKARKDIYIYIWCICDVCMKVVDKMHLLRKRLLNNRASRYHTTKRIFFSTYVEHYRLPLQMHVHFKKGIGRTNSYRMEAVHLAFLLYGFVERVTET